MQLVVDGKVALHDTMKNVPHGFTYGEKEVIEKFGVPPDAARSTCWRSWATRSTTCRAFRASGPRRRPRSSRPTGRSRTCWRTSTTSPTSRGCAAPRASAKRWRPTSSRCGCRGSSCRSTRMCAVPVAARRAQAARAGHGTGRDAAARAGVLPPARPLEADRAQAAHLQRRRAGQRDRARERTDYGRSPSSAQLPNSHAQPTIDRQSRSRSARRRRRSSPPRRSCARSPRSCCAPANWAWRSSRPPASPSSQLGAALIGLALASPGRPPVYVPVGHRYLGVPLQLDAMKALDILSLVLGAGQPRKHVYGAQGRHRSARPLQRAHGRRRLRSADRVVPARSQRRARLSSLCGRRLGATIEGRASCSARARRRWPTTRSRWHRAALYAACQAEGTLAVGPSCAPSWRRAACSSCSTRSSCRWRACWR